MHGTNLMQLTWFSCKAKAGSTNCPAGSGDRQNCETGGIDGRSWKNFRNFESAELFVKKKLRATNDAGEHMEASSKSTS